MTDSHLPTPDLQNRIKENLDKLNQRMNKAAEKAGRKAGDIDLVAVTKSFPAEYLLGAAQAGLKIVGENRAQEAAEKHTLLNKDIPDSVKWHFIGHLQTNKVKYLLDFVDVIQSLDRPSLASEINKRAARMDKVQRVLVEVNVSGEAAKGGILYDEALDFIASLKDYSNLRVDGLMTMAPFTPNPEETRPVFKRLRQLFAKADKVMDSPSFDCLSMGMTDDFEVAIEEGSTMVRIGRAIFGDRPL